MDKYNGTWYADREKSIDQCQSSWLPHVIKLHLIRHEILSDIIIVFRIEQIISLSIFDLNNTKQTEILMEAKPFLWCANLCTRTDRLGLISLVPHIIKLNLITSVILVIGTYYDHSLYSVDQIMSLSFSGSNTQSEQKQSKSPSPSLPSSEAQHTEAAKSKLILQSLHMLIPHDVSLIGCIIPFEEITA